MSTSLETALRQLLREGNVTTQEVLCDALEQQGHQGVNQSKVSRLLRKVGAVKSKNAQGQVVYRMPLEPAPPQSDSQVGSLIMGMAANETMIVVYTSPGAAPLIARILDHHKQKIEILGCIAGDDTIFVAPRSIQALSQIQEKIRQLIF